MINKRLCIVLIGVFFLGWLAHAIYGALAQKDALGNTLDLGIDIPLPADSHIEETKGEKASLADLFFEKDVEEKISPYDRIRESQIHVLNNRVVIDIADPEWASFTDTNSMDPLFDYGSNAIEIVPKSSDELHVGDIVSYRSEYAEGVIIHRIIKIAEDEKGWYAVLKGDNNEKADPGKIRFDQIERVLVAIIY
jgi:hypothetical protein